MTIDLRYGDTIEQMKLIPDKSIDFICCDLPYGTTSCSWDTIIPFDKLWEQYKRIIKSNKPIVLFGSQPFTTVMINSNMHIESSRVGITLTIKSCSKGEKLVKLV